MKPTDSKPHIIFVFPPGVMGRGLYLFHQFNINIGASYVISYLNKNGFIARQFLADDSINLRECVTRILAEKPEVVGFTTYDSNYQLCQLIAKALKETDPGLIILFGGPTPSVQADIILKNNPFVDICVKNEGEETCLELLAKLNDVNFNLEKAYSYLENIKGISYRIENRVFENPGRDTFYTNRNIPDYLDRYPSPYLSGILKSGKLGMLTARGCNRNCIFCNCAAISKRTIATHSVDRVIEEMDYISKKFGENCPVDIFDDAFTLQPDRALEICNKIIENKIKVTLACVTRCDCVNEELLEKMKEAGFKGMAISLESAVPRILRIIGKMQHPDTRADKNFEKEKEFIEKFKKVTAFAKKIGFDYLVASIMVGLPTETLEEGRQTIELIESISDRLDYYTHNIFQVYPGTPIFYNYEKYGLKLVKFDNNIHYQTLHTYDTTRVPLAPNANIKKDSVSSDKKNIETLTLFLTGNDSDERFNQVILCNDIITEELVLWLQKHMALNGNFVQVYSNLEQAQLRYLDNKNSILNYISPTTYHSQYYQTGKKNGKMILVPLRFHTVNPECGITINMVNTGMALSHSSSTDKINPSQSICIDRKKEDVYQLHRLLVDLSNKDNTIDTLFNAAVYPYFSSLCRWEKSPANCKSLEIIIIDQDNNIKTCWHGEPIGKVGMPLPEIRKNLSKLHEEAENKRDCKSCAKKPVCTKCIFPFPLAAEEYCNLKKGCSIEETAELIRTFDIFKE